MRAGRSERPSVISDKAGASVKGAFMVILPEDFGRLSVPVDSKYPLIIEPNLMTMKQELNSPRVTASCKEDARLSRRQKRF